MVDGLLVEEQFIAIVVRLGPISKTFEIVHSLCRFNSVPVVYVVISAASVTVDVLLSCFSVIKDDGDVD